MNKLERHIRENREQFDAFEPSEGHMERFRARLHPARISIYSRIPYGLKAAVVLLLVAISSVLIYEQGRRLYVSHLQPVNEILPGDFGEAQVYYTSLIREKYSEIDRLDGSDPEGKEILMKELGEMDQMFNSLLRDLKTNPSDERILSAMITHYQLKLEVIGQIIDQLQKANQTNSTIKSHDETDI
jgi:hypothetical protein